MITSHRFSERGTFDRSARFSWTIISIALLLPVALAAQQTYEVLYNFGPLPSPVYPWSGLVQDSSGNLYGTSSGGGPGVHGTIFKLAPDGAVTVLRGFGVDGDAPYAA